MIKIRLIYDDDREAAEVIRLLAPRLNYCRMPSDTGPKMAYLGIRTADLLVDLANENADEASKLAEILDDTPYTERRDD